jgi:SNF2 family DNA or RNA helicase
MCAGTPIVNGAEDLGSLFEFLQVKPLQSSSVFRQAISRPVRAQGGGGEQPGIARLR